MKVLKYIQKHFVNIWAILAIFLLVILPQIQFGVSKNNIERDARKSQEIQDDWITASSINDDLGALIFYPKYMTHSTFSVYQKGNGFSSFGYHFRYGGSQPDIDQRILQINTSNKGSILLSMNKLKVTKIEILTGSDHIDLITIDPEKPFTTLLPPSYVEFKIYDSNNNIIPSENISVNPL